MATYSDPWHRAAKDKVHRSVIDYVSAVEQAQCDTFERFLRLECLYDPAGPVAAEHLDSADQLGATENIIAQLVDTVHAAISTVDVRSRFMTDDAEWSIQKRAVHLEWYVEAVAKKVKRRRACQLAFKSAAKKGTGLVKVFVDGNDEVRVEHVLPDDVIVDEKQCRHGGAPREMHQRRFVDKDLLADEFPRHAEAIRKLTPDQGSAWTGVRDPSENEVVLIESWCLPFGKPNTKSYRPGRHTIVTTGLDLVDEEWTKPHFPLARIAWIERDNGWYGISLAEGNAGLQRAHNRRSLQIERALDQGAFPTTWVQQVDAGLVQRTVNDVGRICVYRAATPPKVELPPAVSGETYQSRNELKQAAFDNSGVSRMTAHGVTPAGLESGEAIRQHRESTTVRFIPQEQAFEQLNLAVDWLILDCCKDLGAKAPTIMRRSKFGARKIDWSKVDMGDVEVQIVAASTLPRTPSGRSQLVLEWAQAGIISIDSAQRLVGHPDLESEISLYTAALEAIEYAIEEIEEGNIVMPEPFNNLEMIVWRGNRRYQQLATRRGVPEEILEALRQYITNASLMISMRQGAANGNTPGAPPADSLSGAPPPGLPPELAAGGAGAGAPLPGMPPGGAGMPPAAAA